MRQVLSVVRIMNVKPSSHCMGRHHYSLRNHFKSRLFPTPHGRLYRDSFSTDSAPFNSIAPKLGPTILYNTNHVGDTEGGRRRCDVLVSLGQPTRGCALVEGCHGIGG